MQQVLAAIRFNYSDTTGQSPFSLLYGREVVLPIDALLQPRRKYVGEEAHQILMEIQHEAFVRVHRRMKKQKRKQAKYADRTARDVDLRVGDPVFLRNHKKTCKLSPSWEPYYRVIEQTSPRTFRVKNQLTGEVVKSNVEHLVLARTEWEPHEPLATDNHRTRLRNVVSEEGSSSENEEEDPRFEEPQEDATGIVDSQNDEEMRSEQEFHSASDGTRQGEEPQELIRALRGQRDGSSSEDDIPLAELRRRLELRNARQREVEAIRRIERSSYSGFSFSC